MIGYVTLGVNDFAASAAFYDELMGLLGAGRFMEMEDGFIAWATAPGQPGISIIRPFDGKAATVGNGTMVAIAVDSPEKVDAVHQQAIALGGSCEGAPGPRGDSGFYAGYFRDPEGHKLNAFYMPAG